MNTHPWQPGEHTRYSPCPRHATSLSRMDFDTAVDTALECTDCVVEFRPTTQEPR